MFYLKIQSSKCPCKEGAFGGKIRCGFHLVDSPFILNNLFVCGVGWGYKFGMIYHVCHLEHYR